MNKKDRSLNKLSTKTWWKRLQIPFCLQMIFVFTRCYPACQSFKNHKKLQFIFIWIYRATLPESLSIQDTSCLWKKIWILKFQVCPSITCSTVRGLILLAIQDGTAEYLEPHANLKVQTIFIMLGRYRIIIVTKNVRRNVFLKILSYLGLKRTAWQSPATTRRPSRMATTESWTPRRYLQGRHS